MFDKLKLVDQQTKDLVAGYIRIIEQQLDNDAIIPSLVITTCILFYHLSEFFSIYGEDMSVDEDCTLLQIACPGNKISRSTAYGNIKINNKYNCIYSWTIQLIKMDIFETFIGIDSSDKKYIEGGFIWSVRYDEKDIFYAIGDQFSVISNDIDQDWDDPIEEGDIVKMNVNTMDKTMAICVNNDSRGVVFKNIEFNDTEYYLAVTLATTKPDYGHTVKLLNFEQIFI